MKRVAVIGLGKMGLLHAGLLSTISDVELVAVCEKSALIRRFSRNVFKRFQIVGDVSDLSRLDLDAVYVTTPPSTHFAVVKAILSGRIAANIFVEKPLASNGADSEELCHLIACQGAGTNMVGYNRRFAVTFRKAKELLDQGVLGKLLFFSAYAYSSDFLGVAPRSSARSRGDLLRDLGCHAVDLAMWFFGDLQVDAVDTDPVMGKDTTDYASFRAVTNQGLVGGFKASWCMENYRLPEIGLNVSGSAGIMTVNDDSLQLKLSDGKTNSWYRQDLGDTTHFLLGGTDYLREDEAFVKGVMEGSDVEPSFRSSAKVDRFVDQVEAQLRPHG